MRIEFKIRITSPVIDFYTLSILHNPAVGTTLDTHSKRHIEQSSIQ